jgi:diguanylate cyclase (GGDEF)-like protein
MKQKILIADDEQCVQKLLARALHSEPYELVSASNGKDAYDIATSQNPDIILLDIEMPGRNGLDVPRQLRQNIQTQMIPVIMVTGHGSVEDEVGGLDMGADDYIAKPFDLEELRARIASALRRNRLTLSANPLTRLPGSPMIEDEVNRRIADRIPFAFLYIDINDFKSYNDAYGFARGDRVIRATAEILLESARSAGGGFVGHIGGDDFIAISDPSCAPDLAQRIVSRFDAQAESFYNSCDRVIGHIQTQDRKGDWNTFPLISLSIGIATTENRTLDHYAKVVQIASEMKAYCKSSGEHKLSRFAFDRRTDA